MTKPKKFPIFTELSTIFISYGLCLNTKNEEHFTLEVGREAAEIIASDSYVLLNIKAKKIWPKIENFHLFHWIFENFGETWIMASY